MRAYPFLQFFAMDLATLQILYLLVVHKPLATPFMNRIEIYNETIVFSCTMLLIAFADYGPQAGETPKEVRDTVGWVYVGLACSVIGVTLLAIFYDAGRSLLAKYRASKEQ